MTNIRFFKDENGIWKPRICSDEEIAELKNQQEANQKPILIIDAMHSTAKEILHALSSLHAPDKNILIIGTPRHEDKNHEEILLHEQGPNLSLADIAGKKFSVVAIADQILSTFSPPEELPPCELPVFIIEKADVDIHQYIPHKKTYNDFHKTT